MKIQMRAGNTELLVYGSIGGDVSARGVAEALKSVKGGLTVRINSPGGDVFEGMAIHNLLAARKPLVIIDGLAASIASVIAMAGQKIRMHAGSMLMIHKPWTTAGGNSNDLQKSADLLNQIEQTMVAAYTKRVKMSAEALASMLEKETWLDAEQALESGFIDEIIEQGADFSAGFDSKVFASIPDAVRAHIEHEQKRSAEIRQLFSLGFDIALDPESLIRDGATIDQVRAEILTELGKSAIPHHGAPQMSCPFEVNAARIAAFKSDAVDALMVRGGLKSFSSISQGAKELAKYNLAGIAEQLLNMHGWSNRTAIPRHGLLQAAITHSSGDFSLLLGETFGKSLAAGYNELSATHKVWTGEREVADFKQATLVRLSETPALELVLEGGEYKYGTMKDDAEHFKVATYGKMFSITRQALINDDLDAFTRMPEAWGRSAMRLECDLTYQALTGTAKLRDGKVLFHADHKNLVDDATHGLTLTGLTAARLKLRMQKGTDGKTMLALEPAFLIVPAALEAAAEQLLASLIDPDRDITGVPNMQFVRRLKLVVEPRLDAASTTAYYLACAPSQCDHITRIYLQGEARPYFEQREGWQVDGLEMKTRLDFAAAALDYRGIVKVVA